MTMIRLLKDVKFNNGDAPSFEKGSVIEAELIGPDMYKTPWGYLYKGEYELVDQPDVFRVKIGNCFYTIDEITANSHHWPDEVNIEATEALLKALC